MRQLLMLMANGALPERVTSVTNLDSDYPKSEYSGVKATESRHKSLCSGAQEPNNL